jgi:hypothetical protein
MQLLSNVSKYLSLIRTAALALLLFACPSESKRAAQQESAATARGSTMTIRDGSTGRLISGAQVHVSIGPDAIDASSDANGIAALGALPEGTASIEVSAAGYRRVVQDVPLDPSMANSRGARFQVLLEREVEP